MSTKEYPIVDNAESFEAALARVREAQKIFATYTQEQVDKIFLAAATAANQMRIPLAKMAVEETGMGVAEDKVIKNHFASEYIYNAYRNVKTCGVLEEDKAVLEAAVKAGAPEGIISWIDIPSLELTNTLMQEADCILATGGPGMVKAAYSSGKPALGVGAGNTPAIIDETADILLAVNSIIHSKTFDNGMICASEQSVIVEKKIYSKVKKEFKARGCYFLNEEETEKVRKTIIINGALNAKIVGQKPVTIAALAGVTIPEETKVLIGEVESVDISEEFAHEKLSPVLCTRLKILKMLLQRLSILLLTAVTVTHLHFMLTL